MENLKQTGRLVSVIIVCQRKERTVVCKRYRGFNCAKAHLLEGDFLIRG